MQGNARKSVHGLPTFLGVYEGYKDEVMEYGSRGWNAETTKQYDGIVLNHIIPHLKDHDKKHIGLITRQDYDEAMNDLRKQGKNGPGKPFEPWDEDGVPAKADYLLRAVVHTAAEHFLCEDCFGEKEIHRTGGGVRTGERQVRTRKSFTVREEKEVRRYLMNNMNKNGSVVGLMLMYALGLRNNEACGANFGFIREFGEYPGHYYMVIPQSTELASNRVKVMGKTANSGRRIPLPDSLAKHLLQLKTIRSIQASKQGYTGMADDLPIACKKGKTLERCSANDLTIAAKRMFEQIGMRAEDLVAINQELMEEEQGSKDELEEDEFREIESDPTAYLFRRNFATHLSILGLSDPEIRYVIGHKIETAYIERRAYNDERLLFLLKRKLDERPLLNPLISEQPVMLESGETVSLRGSKKIVVSIPAEKISKIKITATAMEPGDEITLRIVSEQENTKISSEYLAYNCSGSDNGNRSVDGLKLYRKKYQEK